MTKEKEKKRKEDRAESQRGSPSRKCLAASVFVSNDKAKTTTQLALGWIWPHLNVCACVWGRRRRMRTRRTLKVELSFFFESDS